MTCGGGLPSYINIIVSRGPQVVQDRPLTTTHSERANPQIIWAVVDVRHSVHVHFNRGRSPRDS